ncbi:PAS domain S-box protein [Flavobacterium sp. W21_SRS_FM6]|uniref:PAS domain S-box protein n=1 Tax=Flavobacterium sp. W21_SRS_FM6 TaxID=3240268 RepID=UPI003F908EED
MPQAVIKKRGTQLVCAAFMLFSHASFALVQPLQTLPTKQFELALYTWAGLFVVVLYLVLMLKIKLRVQRNLWAQQRQTLTQTLALMDNFNEGMVHLDKNKRIVFLNQAACYLLGKSSDDILHTDLNDCFNQQNQAKLMQLFGQTTHDKVQVFERNRHVAIVINRPADFSASVCYIVSLTDITNYQLKIDQQAKQLTQFDARLSLTKLARVSLDLTKKTYHGDVEFAALLQNEHAALSGELSEFNSLIQSTDRYEFNQAIERIKSQEQSDFRCQFSGASQPILTQVFVLVISRSVTGEPVLVELIVQNLSELAEQTKQAEVSLHLSQAVFNSTRNGMYLLDVSGQILSCNAAFESLFKTHQNKVKSRFVHELDFLPEDIRQLHPTAQCDSPFSRVGQSKEFTLRTLDNHVRYLRFSLKHYADKQGNKAGMLGIFEDVTELRNTKLTADKACKRFTDLLNLAPLSIAITDSNDNILEANDTLVKRLGTSPKDLKKSNLYQLFTEPSSAATAVKILQKEGRLHQYQANLSGKNGASLPSAITIDVFDKELKEHLCWISDTSEQLYQTQRFERIFSDCNEPMALLDELSFIKANQAAADFFAVQEPQQLLALSPCDERFNQNIELARTLAQTITKVRQSGKKQSLLWEHQINQLTQPCQLELVPILKANVCVQVLCIWKDFRAIKEAERARLEAINLHQAAERKVAEKQQLLESSQDLLANKAKNLAETQTQLQAAQIDLTVKQNTISDLEQAHQDSNQQIEQLQQAYQSSREKLAHSQDENEALSKQLESSVVKVRGLQEQRNQIADALQYSERKYTNVQNQLAKSEQTTQSLQHEQQVQQQKMHDFATQIDVLKASIIDKDKQISDVSSQINTLQSQLSSSGRATEKLRESLINQRKASAQAEQERRELEFACHSAQTELSSKARHIEHLQHEMEKFEEMSQQQQGNMAQQHSQLQQELAAKQAVLKATQQQLDETQQASLREKAEKEQQHTILITLQNELVVMEREAELRQQKMLQASQQWQQQQKQLQHELLQKQQKLQESEDILSEAKQQTEAEIKDKAKHQAIFAQLQQDLLILKKREEQQQQQIQQSESQWLAQQEALKNEAFAKQQALQKTQQKLDEKQRVADAEKRQRLEQQHQVEQLSVELADVEKRAAKQQELMQGSEEERRQFLAEIEQQKHQLQQALDHAQQQNLSMKDTLDKHLHALKKAESQVSQTVSGEQKLQEELNKARQEAQELAARLQRQEQQELALQQQLAEQQQVLQGSEHSINELQSKQGELTKELCKVQQEYDNRKQSLDAQDSSQSKLSQQLEKLEQALTASKSQLALKEKSLQDAQQQVQLSQARLAKQEQTLVAAHKVELQQAHADEPKTHQRAGSHFAQLPLPANPHAWFALLPFLQQQTTNLPLPIALTTLMDELDEAINAADIAMQHEDLAHIKQTMAGLAKLTTHVNSLALSDQMSRLEADCAQGLIDNITIAWPSLKKSLLTTLRVIYSHLHA